MSYGDRLASGQKSAIFRVSENITQEKWDAIWSQDEEDEIEIYRQDKNGDHKKVIVYVKSSK